MLGTFSNFAAERVPSTMWLYSINLRFNLFFIFIIEQTNIGVNLTTNITTITDKCKCSVFTKPSYLSRIVAWTQSSLTCSSSSCSTENTSQPVCWCQAHTGTSLPALPALPTSGTPPSWLSPESSRQLPSAHLMRVWSCLED